MKYATLGEVARIVSGATPKSATGEYWGGDVNWATPADLANLDGAYLVETPRKLTRAGLASCAATELPVGSVLLSSRAPIGYVAINGVPMATNQGFKSIVPFTDQLESGYLYHWLRSKKDFLQDLGNGATFKELSKDTVSRLKIPLPSIEDQRRAVRVLDMVSSMTIRRSQVERLIESLTASYFWKEFGDEKPSETVVEVASFTRTGPFGSQLRHDEFVDEGVAVLGLDNVVGNEFRWAKRRYITHEKYEQLRRYKVEPADVLISIMGTTGRCVVVPDDIPTAITTKHICAITADRTRVEPEFLRAAFLWHPESRAHLKRQTKGSIMDGLNMGIIKSMPIPVPPLYRQQEFAKRVAMVANQRAAVRKAQAAGDELFAALQHRAFRGEL